LFRRMKRELPAPATLSEQNGPSVDCGNQRWATYTLLEATAAKLPLTNDADLVRLVPWARDSDVCVRQTALSAVVANVAYDGNNLVLPHMHDPEHHIYHDILFSLKAHLDHKGVAYNPEIFDGLLLAVDAKDYPELVHGRWEQEVDRTTVSV